jgi:hypothetical protein
MTAFLQLEKPEWRIRESYTMKKLLVWTDAAAPGHDDG